MIECDFSKLNNGDVVAVALSGGVDSVCLFDILYKERSALGITLVAINVEHGIRGAESLADSEFCQKLCDDRGVKLIRYFVDAPGFARENGYSLEQAARILRYDRFFDAIKQGLCDKIATAHHLSDQAETVLFNILRGSSLTGAKGIPTEAYDGRIIRPLLGVLKDDLIAYAKDNGLKYVHDASNDDTAFTRNAIRLKIIPTIKEIFPECERSLARFARSASADDEYLYSLAKTKVETANNFCKIPTGSDYPLFSRAVIIALKHLGAKKDFEKVHVDDVYALCFNQVGKSVDLPNKLVAIKERDHIIIKPKSANSGLIAPLFDETDVEAARLFDKKTIAFGDKTIIVEKVEKSKVVFGDGLYFDIEKVPLCARFRCREDGDKFKKFNGQTVTLKKYLTDKKVPAAEKKDVIVLADEKNVFLVVGLEISSAIKIDNDTKNVVRLYCIDNR
ncbi:MAG: tRNA lysidine(34) synthetase TilS [Clostridia bacterium]|nr:tRNA lysidine(34) synthetase TilS [Clostridia bacterium]